MIESTSWTIESLTTWRHLQPSVHVCICTTTGPAWWRCRGTYIYSCFACYFSLSLSLCPLHPSLLPSGPPSCERRIWSSRLISSSLPPILSSSIPPALSHWVPNLPFLVAVYPASLPFFPLLLISTRFSNTCFYMTKLSPYCPIFRIGQWGHVKTVLFRRQKNPGWIRCIQATHVSNGHMHMTAISHNQRSRAPRVLPVSKPLVSLSCLHAGGQKVLMSAGNLPIKKN